VIEYSKRQWMRRLERRAGPRTGPSDSARTAESETVAADGAAVSGTTAAESDTASMGAEDTR
jgi:hypothetical protein